MRRGYPGPLPEPGKVEGATSAVPPTRPTLTRMAERDHNPGKRRLHLPIVGVTNGTSGDTGVNARGERKPPWLKVRLASGPNYTELKGLMRGLSLNTVCEEAMCPNIAECWEDREATFLILGSKCTRRCGFCDVMTAKPDPVDADEPAHIAHAVHTMGLRHVVLTGVARDDLPDGGAGAWASTIRAVRGTVPGCRVEVLPSDFKGGERDILTVIDAGPDVFAHNLETVRRLHGRIRPAFGYERSLEVLRIAKRHRAEQVTKSNLILGMGEHPEEVAEAMRDLVDAGCDILTMGQYLQPTSFHLPVDRWVTPDEFAAHARTGEALGIRHVEAGPLVRSSYHAGSQLRRAMERGVVVAGT
jgi:lipoyl synthase